MNPYESYSIPSDESYSVPGGVDGHYDDDIGHGSTLSPKNTQVSSYHGHTVDPNIKTKNDSTLKNCVAAVSKFFKNPPFVVQLGFGLTLIGVAAVIFVALSPKLLILAIAVGAVGLTVLMIAFASKKMKSSNKKNNTLTIEAQAKINDELIGPLNFLIKKLHDNEFSEKLQPLQGLLIFIKQDPNSFFSTKPDELDENIYIAKKNIVFRLLGDFKNPEDVNIFNKLVTNPKNPNIFHIVKSLFDNSEVAEEILDETVSNIFDALTAGFKTS